MNRENLAVAYVNSLREYEKAAEPIVEFDRMLNQWKSQRQFTWAGVKLEMTDEVAQLFRNQLASNLESLRQQLNTARDLLNA